MSDWPAEAPSGMVGASGPIGGGPAGRKRTYQTPAITATMATTTMIVTATLNQRERRGLESDVVICSLLVSPLATVSPRSTVIIRWTGCDVHYGHKG
jgi:hypothetical protein